MKRCAELKPLSFEHHDALVMARYIELGLRGSSELPELVTYIREIYTQGLKHHFKLEEQILFPVCKKYQTALPGLNQLMHEHQQLSELHLQILIEGNAVRELIAQFATLLHDHIRYEEREFFPLVEKILSKAELKIIGSSLQQTHRSLFKECQI